jgi:hypothetical protein
MTIQKSPTHKINTLLKNAQANAESNFFKRVFFSATQEKLFFQRYFFYFFSPTHRHILQTCNDTAMNVNRFGDSVCGLRTTHLRGESMPAANRVDGLARFL